MASPSASNAIELFHVIGRRRPLFTADMQRHAAILSEFVRSSRFLVLGGAGSIGREVVLQLAARRPAALDVVDLSENNLVEVTRLLRSSIGHLGGADRYFPIDISSPVFAAFLAAQAPYDVVFNFTAMKHVRSEKDPWSLMRMIDVNVVGTRDTLAHAVATQVKKYFCVSTDKAKSPANAMGASKRVMEMMLAASDTGATQVSTARFANVAFSDGSLLDGFRHRLARRQPIAAPRDIRRYFLTGEEAGQLCLLAAALGRHMELFFPKLDEATDTIEFAELARRFLRLQGFEPVECGSEEEARGFFANGGRPNAWPCFFTSGDTTGEKDMEEFYGEKDRIDWKRFADVAVIEGFAPPAKEAVSVFLSGVARLRGRGHWSRDELIGLLSACVPEFGHLERGQFLDARM